MLRHRIDVGDMRAIDRTQEKREPIPRFRPATKVLFRRDGDLTSVVNALQKSKFVELGAAVGAGKSTKCPMLIAQAMGKLVIHTIPFHISAHRLADYLVTTSIGDHVVYVDDVDSDLPSHGVAIMTNAHLFERIANHGMDHVLRAILYLDEIHESDSATSFFREAAPAMGFFGVVKATATSGPGENLKADLPGQRVQNTYDRGAVPLWSANQPGKPWSADSIDGHTLICVDRESVRTALAVEYRNLGFDVRVHTSSADYQAYRETERRLLDQNSGIVIVLVDYAFRSSLTIPGLSRIVDSCEVAVPSVQDGAPVVKYRPAYDFEVQQLLGRGARLAGENVTLYRSKETSPKYMCDLEVLEADAANLLFRMMGFRPPHRLVEHAFYEGNVPVDIAAALRGGHPARLCPDESREPWVNGNRVLLEAKRREAFTYSAPKQYRAKPVSCHTLVDVSRPKSPSPPVPIKHAVTTVDVDGLDEYASSRSSSEIGKTRTVDEECDNLSVLMDLSTPFYPKPKRISQRVRDQRAAEAAEAEMAKQLDAEGLARDVVEQAPDVVDAGDANVGLMRDAATTAGLRRLGSVVHNGVSELHDHLQKRDKGKHKHTQSLSDDELGSYVHYYDMDRAKTSGFFLRGVSSVLTFAEQDQGANVRGLPPDERLYAMRVLVDAYNGSVAVAFGIQRLFFEISKRDPDEFKDLVDDNKMIETLKWMTNECASAQAKVRLYRDTMSLYMDRRLSVIQPAVELEQRVMVEMVKKFDDAAVKKDPDKLTDYVRRLNGRAVKLSSANLPTARLRRGIEFT